MEVHTSQALPRRLAILVALASITLSCDGSTAPQPLAGTYTARTGDGRPFPLLFDQNTPASQPGHWITGADVEIFAGDSLRGHVYVDVIGPDGKKLSSDTYLLWDTFTISGDTLYRDYATWAPVAGVIHGSTVDLSVYWEYPPSTGYFFSVHTLKFLRN